MHVTKFSNHSVVVKEDWEKHQYLTLDWKDFIDRINNYKGDDFSFDKVNENTINTQVQKAEVMVSKIVDFLKVALGVIMSVDDVAALSKTVLNVFTNLQDAEHHDWASWSKTDDKKNSSWEYRLLFAVPMEDSNGKPDPDYFYALVTTTTLTSDILEKTEWWGLQKTTTRNFSAQINTVRLIVEKGFNPPK